MITQHPSLVTDRADAIFKFFKSLSILGSGKIYTVLRKSRFLFHCRKDSETDTEVKKIK